MTFKELMQQYLERLKARAAQARRTEWEQKLQAEVLEIEVQELSLTLERWDKETAP